MEFRECFLLETKNGADKADWKIYRYTNINWEAIHDQFGTSIWLFASFTWICETRTRLAHVVFSLLAPAPRAWKAHPFTLFPLDIGFSSPRHWWQEDSQINSSMGGMVQWRLVYQHVWSRSLKVLIGMLKDH